MVEFANGPGNARAPAQLAGSSPARQCRICRSTHGRSFEREGFAWFNCRNCRTTQKVLSRQEYELLNPSYDPGLFLDSLGRDQIERYIQVPTASRILAHAARHMLRSAAAPFSPPLFLDIGCGMGAYLVAARRLGYDVLGFEPSKDHARLAMKHFNLPIVADYFTRAAVSGRTFDLVMLSHVIEHIYDPPAFLREVLSVLKPGGVLVILTPNNESFLARMLGKAWPMLAPVDHVSLLGPTAFGHFKLQHVNSIHHSSTEYPYETAAAAVAAIRRTIRLSRAGAEKNSGASRTQQPPLLRNPGVAGSLAGC